MSDASNSKSQSTFTSTRKTDNDTIYSLIQIPGMKYSHSKPDSVFNTLLEGNCPPSKNISVEFIDTKTQRIFLKNIFIAK